MFVLSTTPLDDEAIADRWQAIRRRPPGGVRIPEDCPVVARRIRKGLSKAKLLRSLQARVEPIHGRMARTDLVVTEGSDEEILEGHFIGAVEEGQLLREEAAEQAVVQARGPKLNLLDVCRARPGRGLGELVMVVGGAVLLVCAVILLLPAIASGWNGVVVLASTFALVGALSIRFSWPVAVEKLRLAKARAPLAKLERAAKKAHRAEKRARAREVQWGGEPCPSCGALAVGTRVITSTIAIGQHSKSANSIRVCIYCSPHECMMRDCRERATRILPHSWTVAGLMLENDLWLCEEHVEATRLSRTLGGGGYLVLALGGLAAGLGALFGMTGIASNWSYFVVGGSAVVLLGAGLLVAARHEQWSGSLRKKPEYESKFSTNVRLYRDMYFD